MCLVGQGNAQLIEPGVLSTSVHCQSLLPEKRLVLAVSLDYF